MVVNITKEDRVLLIGSTKAKYNAHKKQSINSC